MVHLREKEVYLLLVSSHICFHVAVKFRKNCNRIRSWTTLRNCLKIKIKLSPGLSFLSSTQNDTIGTNVL